MDLFSPSIRTQLDNFDYRELHKNSISMSSSSDMKLNSISCVSPNDRSHMSQQFSQQATLRRRRTTPPPESVSDPAIGQVTRLGKFKCLDPGCNDLTFGRQADFKRHYENVHAACKRQYFCPEDGCERSKNPAGGKSKGRSFNGRKDKMEEHVRTIHQKDNLKKRRYDDAEDVDDGHNSDKGLKGKRLKAKHQGLH